MTRRTVLMVIAAATLAACSSETSGPVVTHLARVDSAGVTANPNMVVSALVWLHGAGDSAYVRYHVQGTPGDSITPYAHLTAGIDTLPVLGLLPQTTYVLRVVTSHSAADTASSDSLVFTTGALPVGLPSYTAGGTAPQAGYIAFGAGQYGLVIDHTGRVVWYKLFPVGGPGLNFMAQPTGVFVGRWPTPDPADDDPMAEISPAGDAGRYLRCGNGRRLRFHDLLVLPDSSYWIMCDEDRTMDLSALGGVAGANVTGTVAQHVSKSGTVLFEWNVFDHFAITDLPQADRTGASVNFTHGNSFDIDTDGNLLISFRSLSEITKVNIASGAVIWRMGGTQNQFTFTGGAETGFTRQHNLRVIGPNQIIILDNVGGAASRFERYLIDPTAKTAALQQAYVSSPPALTLIGGSVQKEASGRFLVSFGTTGNVNEFDSTGTLLWKINGNPGYVFRAQRLLSLYHPVPTATR